MTPKLELIEYYQVSSLPEYQHPVLPVLLVVGELVEGPDEPLKDDAAHITERLLQDRDVGSHLTEISRMEASVHLELLSPSNNYILP